jgi:hypothetical protein
VEIERPIRDLDDELTLEITRPVHDPEDEPTVRMEREATVVYESTIAERNETSTPAGRTQPLAPESDKRVEEELKHKPSSVVPPDEHERARRRKKDRERQ